jgi:cellulose synthase/poly-beta-1,6-N-acetylglucosamine synthase-like glycosyltransferase
MSTLLLVANLLLLLALLVPAGMVAYLLLLTMSACLAGERQLKPSGRPAHRILFLIPAHNEAALLPATLSNLRQLDYPAELYEVHVVADNCSDNTAELARAGGAVVHKRSHDTLKGKGYALQWLLKRLWAAGTPHDALVILDADSIVSRNFLRLMDAHLTAGARAVQAYSAVRDADSSPVVGLRYIGMAMVNYLRPLGRMRLGGSAGLKGNGMLFRAELLHQHEWTGHLTEDIEFHMSLIAAGEQVLFAPDAVVWSEMPKSLVRSTTQNERWERGRLEMLRRYAPRLVRDASRALGRGQWRLAYLNFDAAIEHLIPPFTVLVVLSLLLSAAAILLFALSFWLAPSALSWATANVLLALFLVVGQTIYLGVSLYLARTPKNTYKALLHAPAFMLWKLVLYGRVLTGRKQKGWIRTPRNEDKSTM